MAARKPEDEPSRDQRKIVKEMRNALNKDDIVAWDLTKNDSPTHVKNFISTGSTLLDIVAANRMGGGIPSGKIIEIQGEEASGKSLLCAHIIANTQRQGGIAVYLDTENAANPDFMRRIGVDLDSLIYVQPGTIEKAFEIIDNVIKTIKAKEPNRTVVILWDSVGNTPPQAEVEGSYDPNSRMGLGAKAMALGLRKTTELIGREEITLVCTQPLTYRMDAGLYGDPFGTKYGKALPYHSSLRIRVSSSTKLKDKDNTVYGLVTNARIIKSRLGPALRSVKFQLHFDHGIDDEQSWYEVLHEGKCINKPGNGWCYIPEIPSGKLEEKGVDAGKDRGLGFREAEFGELCRKDPKIREWALKKLGEILVVKYEDSRPVRDGEEIPNEDAQIPVIRP